MIPIDMEVGFVVYLLLMLGGLVAAGIYAAWREHARRWSVSEEQLGRCSQCGLTFIVPREEAFARCPRCRTLHISRRRGFMERRPPVAAAPINDREATRADH